MKLSILIMLCAFMYQSFAQKILELNYYSFLGKSKSYQFFNNSNIDYKLKGDLFYKTHKLVNLNDSMLIFDNDSAVKLSALKAIKIKGALISPWLFTAGALFFILDTGNNIMNGNPTIVNQQTVVVSSTLLLGGIIVRRIQDKHVYIRKNVTIRVLDTDYQNLNATK